MVDTLPEIPSARRPSRREETVRTILARAAARARRVTATCARPPVGAGLRMPEAGPTDYVELGGGDDGCEG